MEFNFSDDETNLDDGQNPYDSESSFNFTKSTIFAIDMHAIDFHDSKSDKTNFTCVIDIYADLMSKRAVSNPKDTYGLIFYNIVS